MTTQASFGKVLGQSVEGGGNASLVSNTAPSGAIAVTKIFSDLPSADRTRDNEREDAIMVCVSLYRGFLRELWLDGRPLAREAPLAAGMTTLLDLRQTVNVFSSTSFQLV